MIGQGIQEKTGTPARCAHRWGKTQAVTAKCSRTPVYFTTKKGGVFPFRRELFTFSTGFSTPFVKKRGGFPQGFPLFPPSFPPKAAANFIRSVAVPAHRGNFWGERRAFFLFSKRKSRAKIYFSRLLAPPHFVLSILECGKRKFSTPETAEKGTVEKMGKRAKEKGRNADTSRPFSKLTSYS